MVLTVYKFDGSPPARAVLMTIAALNLTNVNFVDVNLFNKDNLKEDYVKLNPQHTVPMLKDDAFVVWDSHAIATYLVSKYGKNDSLYPADLQKRATIDQRLHFDSGVLFSTLRSAVVPVFFGGEKSFRPENLDKIKEAYGFAESFLTSTWMAGDQLTLADISCVATISSMEGVLPIDAEKYPKLSAWVQRCSKQDFFQKGNKDGLELYKGFIKSAIS